MQIAGGVAGSAVKGASLGSLFGPIGSAIGGAAGGIAGLWNAWQGTRTAKWQKEAQETTWNREDTAQQRAVTDLRAAGLSPTLAAGHGAPTSAPVRPETPQYDPSAALALMKMKADISRTAAETRLINANAKVAESTSDMRISSAMKDLGLKDLETRLKSMGLSKAQIEYEIQKRLKTDVYDTGVVSRGISERTNLTAAQAATAELERQLIEKYGDPGKALGLYGSGAQIIGTLMNLGSKFFGGK